MSGKGGTGKTTLASAFCRYIKGNSVIVDADVDAANLHLVLEHTRGKEEEVEGGKIAKIDPVLCTSCGECYQACQFDAIVEDDGKYKVIETACEGCAVCKLVCPVDAVTLTQGKVGRIFESLTPYGRFFHALLYPGGESSGKVVTILRDKAEDAAVTEKKELILIDGPPGIGCAAVASLTGVSMVLVVAEPTVSGWHDMMRVISLASFFNIPCSVCVNRADINDEMTRSIETFCREESILFLGVIPVDEHVVEAQLKGHSVVEAFPESPASRAIEEVYNALKRSMDLSF